MAKQIAYEAPRQCAVPTCKQPGTVPVQWQPDPVHGLQRFDTAMCEEHAQALAFTDPAAVKLAERPRKLSSLYAKRIP